MNKISFDNCDQETFWSVVPTFRLEFSIGMNNTTYLFRFLHCFSMLSPKFSSKSPIWTSSNIIFHILQILEFHYKIAVGRHCHLEKKKQEGGEKHWDSDRLESYISLPKLWIMYWKDDNPWFVSLNVSRMNMKWNTLPKLLLPMFSPECARIFYTSLGGDGQQIMWFTLTISESNLTLGFHVNFVGPLVKKMKAGKFPQKILNPIKKYNHSLNNSQHHLKIFKKLYIYICI